MGQVKDSLWVRSKAHCGSGQGLTGSGQGVTVGRVKGSLWVRSRAHCGLGQGLIGVRSRAHCGLGQGLTAVLGEKLLGLEFHCGSGQRYCGACQMLTVGQVKGSL